MKIKAYAKINLTLYNLGLRPDGFHNLDSIALPVEIADVVTLRRVRSATRVVFCGKYAEGIPAENTVTKAVRLFNEAARKKDCYNIRVRKNIPPRAGLGGSSASAAATLQLLNRLHCNPLTQEALAKIAEGIGSDVPFFLLRQAGRITERGNIVTPIDCPRPLYLILAMRGAGIGTKECFNAADAIEQPPAQNNNDNLADTLKAELSLSAFPPLANDLYPSAKILSPEIEQVLTALSALSPYTGMTGSGAAVFALFDSKRERDRAYRQLTPADFAFLARTNTL